MLKSQKNYLEISQKKQNEILIQFFKLYKHEKIFNFLTIKYTFNSAQLVSQQNSINNKLIHLKAPFVEN